MKKKIIVLDAGLAGKAIGHDLSKTIEVTSVDNNEEAFRDLATAGIKTKPSLFEFTNYLREHDVCYEVKVTA